MRQGRCKVKKLSFILAFAFIAAIIPFYGCKQVETERTVYTVSAVFDGKDSLSAEMTVDYYNNTQTEITALKFNLYPNAFRKEAKRRPYLAQHAVKAFPNGISYGGITIENCFYGDEVAEWEICGEDDNILVLYLKKGVFPAERAKVAVHFKITLPSAALRFGFADGRVNLGNWYPILCAWADQGFYECEYYPIGDPFYSEVADYNIKLTVPGEYIVASGGECVMTEVGETATTYTYLLENHRDIAFVLSKDFNVNARKTGDVTINYYYVDGDPNLVLDVAEQSLNLYSQLFGVYPYPTLTIAQTPFIQGGMEFPSLVYIADGLDDGQTVEVVAHEIAHQWWYATVGNNQLEHAFLDEGLAEYSTVLFYENNPAYGVTYEDCINNKIEEYRAFCGVYEQLNGSVDTAMIRNLDKYGGEYGYVEICYCKSALMFDGFRESVGDAKFFKGLKKFYEDNLFEVAAPQDLIAAFERVGCDAEGYFNAWIEGKVVI